MDAKEWLAPQVENQVEALAARLVCALEIDGAHRAARRHARAMVLAAIEIDLIAPVDRALGARLDARIATRADVQIDGVVLGPFDLECAQPSPDAPHGSGIDRIFVLNRKLDAARSAGDERRHGKVLMQLVGP